MFGFAVGVERVWSALPAAIRLLAVVLAVAAASHTNPFRWE